MTTTLAPLVVEVFGDPAPQGSKRHVGGGRLIESSKNVGPWREHVAVEVRRVIAATGWVTLDAPCRVEVAFYLRKPASVRRVWPSTKPDLDKLQRAVFDALVTAGAITDDARIVVCESSKRYGAGFVGVCIQVAQWPDVLAELSGEGSVA